MLTCVRERGVRTSAGKTPRISEITAALSQSNNFEIGGMGVTVVHIYFDMGVFCENTGLGFLIWKYRTEQRCTLQLISLPLIVKVVFSVHLNLVGTSPPFASPRAMPQLSKKELDRIFQRSAKGDTPVEIHQKLVKSRQVRRETGPDLTTVRRSLRGHTHQRGRKENRGAKVLLTAVQLQRLNTKRKELIRRAEKQSEVHLDDVMTAARIDHVAPPTVSRHFKKKFGVQWRPPRSEPLRDAGVEKERVRICKQWKHFPNSYFESQLDGIMDNKQWDIVITKKGKAYKKMTKVRGHLRTRAEGIKKDFTKPKSSKGNRVNPGGAVSVCCVVINCKVKVWEYLASPWCGDVAAKLYKGPVIKALRKHRGAKAVYRILEDNDPTGYKSRAGKAAKKAVGIKPIEFPRYSPDLNPLDFSLWSEIEERMTKGTPGGPENAEEYKRRLRRTALRSPKTFVQAPVATIKAKAAEVVQAEGGRIASD